MFNGRIPIDKDARVKTKGRFMTGEEVLLEKIQKIEEDIKYIKKEMVDDTSAEDIVDNKREIEEIKEEIFSLTMQVERLQECEQMEQEEKGRKNKMYIVHRRVGDGTERYLGQPLKMGGKVVIYENVGEKYKATKFTMEEAIKVRNKANKHCESCLMLWVISEVK